MQKILMIMKFSDGTKLRGSVQKASEDQDKIIPEYLTELGK